MLGIIQGFEIMDKILEACFLTIENTIYKYKQLFWGFQVKNKVFSVYALEKVQLQIFVFVWKVILVSKPLLKNL